MGFDPIISIQSHLEIRSENVVKQFYVLRLNTLRIVRLAALSLAYLLDYMYRVNRVSLRTLEGD